MKLILVRHGETDANRLRQYIGRTDVALNEMGREQAREAARQMADFEIHQVFYSPYRRTAETAILIVQHLEQQVHLPIASWVVDQRLAELHFGDWEGLTYREAEQRDRARLWAWYEDPWNITPPNGESLGELERRVASWVEDVTGTHFEEETLLVVSHGGPCRWFLAEYVLGDRGQFHVLKWEPGQVVVCSYEAGTWKLEKGEVDA